MEKLSDLYAILEKNPVKISYPKSQTVVTADYDPWKLRRYKYNYGWMTFYTFGKCKVIYNVKPGCENAVVKAELSFINKERGNSYSFDVSILQNKGDMTLQNKQYIELFEQIKNKANGKEITNPFYNKINNAVFDLQSYVRNDLPHGSNISREEVEKLYNQLNEIRLKLVSTQNMM